MANFGFPFMDDIPLLPHSPQGSVPNRKLAVTKACTEIKLDGDWAEFGVWKGDTALWMLPYLPETSSLYLFDSFEGLARDWSGLPKGSFKLDNPPVFDDARVTVVNGWFEDTVQNTLHNKNISFVHVDCDLYESALDCLWSLPPLRSGTLILFDEFVHDLGGKHVDDEYRALTEWSTDNNYQFNYLWRTAWTQVCVEIL